MPADLRSTADAGYIRGGAGAAIDLRRVLQVILAISIAGLLAAVVVTTVSAASQNSRRDQLQHHGVPVTVTITGCTGYGSGIAQAVNYYQCTGSYTLDGRSYTEVIGGLRSRVPNGQELSAVALRGDPASVRTTASVAKAGSRFAPYITPIGLGAVAVVLGVGLAYSFRRRVA